MGWSEKRGNTWRARWRRPDGTYDSESGFLTEAQADAHWQEQETDVRRGDYFDPRHGDITMAAWAAQWLEAINVAPSSEEGYRKRLRAKILPRWGDWPLSGITTSAIRIWEKQLRASVSKNYADAVMLVFRLLLEDAVSDRLIKESPIPPVNRRRGRYTAPPRPEKVIGTAEQVLQLAENARQVWGLPGYAFILTKAYCGLRQGELYGLRREWCYPNWPASDPGWPANPDGAAADRKRIRLARERYATMPALRVQWQHQYVRPAPGMKAAPTLTDPKYGSRRDLVLPLFLAELLAELLESHDSEWVFPSMDGGPLLVSDFSTYYWLPTLLGAEERAGRYARPAIDPVEGLEEMKPHGLRHGMKVWLDEDGHSRVAVEERMGHRLQGVEGVYSQMTPAMEARIAETLQERWEKARRS